MKIFQTNAALGYGELVYLLKIDETRYLVIDNRLYYSDDKYRIGSIEEFKEDEQYYLECTSYTLEESPLYGGFLFMEFLKGLKCT